MKKTIFTILCMCCLFYLQCSKSDNAPDAIKEQSILDRDRPSLGLQLGESKEQIMYWISKEPDMILVSPKESPNNPSVLIYRSSSSSYTYEFILGKCNSVEHIMLLPADLDLFSKSLNLVFSAFDQANYIHASKLRITHKGFQEFDLVREDKRIHVHGAVSTEDIEHPFIYMKYSKY